MKKYVFHRREELSAYVYVIRCEENGNSSFVAEIGTHDVNENARLAQVIVNALNFPNSISARLRKLGLI